MDSNLGNGFWGKLVIFHVLLFLILLLVCFMNSRWGVFS